MDAQLDLLPFVVVHGWAVWLLAFAAWITLVFVVVRLLYRRAARKTPGKRANLLKVLLITFVTGALSWIAFSTSTVHSWLLDVPAPDRPIVLSNVSIPALLTATPRREFALNVLSLYLHGHPYQDEATMRSWLALQRLTDRSCKQSIERLFKLWRYEEVVALGQRCNNRKLERESLIQLGHFVEAKASPSPVQELQSEERLSNSAEDDPPTPSKSDQQVLRKEQLSMDVQLLLATGKWSEAAAAAEEMAGIYSTDASDELAIETESPHMKLIYKRNAADSLESAAGIMCLAELMRHHGGDRTAATRLRTLAGGPNGNYCTPVLFELLSPTERAQQFTGDYINSYMDKLEHEVHPQLDTEPSYEYRVKHPPSRSPGRLFLLAWAEGLLEARWQTESPAVMLARLDMLPKSVETEYAPWLAAATLAELPQGAPPERRARLLAWATVAQVYAGDTQAAAESARAAVAAGLAPTALAASVALYTPATALGLTADSKDAKYRHDFARLFMRQGESIEKTWHYFVEMNLDPEQSFATAQRGDGRLLARRIAGDYGYYNLWDGDVMAVLPRVKTARQEIAHHLSWPVINSASLPPPYLAYQELPAIARHAVVRRDVLRMAGARAEADRWDAIYRRYERALSSRQQLGALMLWCNYW